MAENKNPEMSDDFLHLCQPINLGANPDFCQRRWSGVCAATRESKPEDVEELIRIVFRGKQQGNTEILNRIRQHFKAADDLFPLSGNDTELEALCAAILTELFKTGNRIGSLAALAVTTAAIFGGRKPGVNLDLVSRAENAISEIAQHLRQRPTFKDFSKVVPLVIDFKDALSKIQQEQNIGGATKALTETANIVQGSVESLNKLILESVEKLSRFVTIQDEELQMLWWIMGGRSWILDKLFVEVPPGAQPIVFAKELADFTKVSPGPDGIRGLLSRTGIRQDRELSIPEAINSCDQEWLSTLVAGKSPSSMTFPIHFAIMRKVETGENEAWIPGWASAANLVANRKLSSLVLGEQFYRERLQTE